VNAACESVRSGGFINYFGLQRFGSGAAMTSQVGRALLREDWKAAVELVMRPREGEHEDASAARANYLARPDDPAAALRQLPYFLGGERAMMAALVRHGPTAYDMAIAAQPKNVQLMYLHAFQSLCWNHAASHRVREHGVARPVPGDLVLLPAAGATDAAAAALETSTDAMDGPEAAAFAASAEATDGGGCASGSGNDGGGSVSKAGRAGPDAAAASTAAGRLPAVHVVTEAEAAAGAFSTADVVLPLPGFLVEYPSHSTGTFYQEFLASQGVAPGDLRGRRRPEYGVGGAYRRLLQWPRDMEWEMRSYDNPIEQLMPTDLTPILGDGPAPPPARPWARVGLLAVAGAAAAAPTTKMTMAAGEVAEKVAAGDAAASGSEDAAEKRQHDDTVSDIGNSAASLVEAAVTLAAAAASSTAPMRRFRALILSFELPSSTYATMCIREVLKQSSSAAHHAKMNDHAAGEASGGCGGGGGQSGGFGSGGGYGGD
ncbi:unnamed protein product, partial [Phaeothamnion confervicola]